MEEDDVPYYCVSQLRCRLCQFSLEDGEFVVAGVDYRRFSSQFPFQLGSTFYDDDIFDVKFHMCGGGCTFRGRRVPCFHGKCFDFRLWPVTPGFLAASDYTFQPSLCEEQRRSDRIRRLLVPKLREVLSARLPEELLNMIAKLLIRECAVVSAQEQLYSGSSDSVVDLSRNVYGRYVVIDGVRYIKSLANFKSKSEDEEEQLLLLDVAKRGHIRKVSVVEDHLGVRLTHFVSSNITPTWPSHMSGVWWKDIYSSGRITKIGTKTDTFKLRNILDASTTTTLANFHTRWAAPEHPTKILDLTTLRHVPCSPTSLRMQYCDFNTLGTTGYSVATDGVGIATIHAHGQDNDIRFYNDVDAGSKFVFWIYMPVDQGEHLTEICGRYRYRHLNKISVSLVFITNRGRCVLFGCYTPTTENAPLQKICAPLKAQSRIFLNDWSSIPEKEIRFLAYKDINQHAVRPYPPSLLPTGPVPCTQYNEPWFYSFCSLEEVTKVIICKDDSLGYKPILGIQLQYTEGHRTCLGQFRFDKTLETFQVKQSKYLCIGSQRTNNQSLYVAKVTMHPPPDPDGLTWLDVPWDGTLEWWFSNRHTIVRYNHTESAR